MALGKIGIEAVNQNQGEFPTVEKFFLFVGEGATNQGDILRLNTDSDLDTELGSASSEIKTAITAARNNAGQNWACAAIPLADGTLWDDAVDLAMTNDVRVEAIVLLTPITASADLTAMQTKAEAINTAYGRRVFFIAVTAEIDNGAEGQSWSDYVTAQTALVTSVNAARVSVVPGLWAGIAGYYAGRLCANNTSVADTPMRVNTGPLVGIDQSELPTDTDGVIYNNAHAKALNDQRFAVPQLYADYPGVFWSDGQTLDAPGGDFAVIENLRVVDKAARAVRLVLIGILGDRKFNSSPIGEAWAVKKLMRPLFEMSRSYVFDGIQFPAELKSPVEGDIAIQWVTRTQVNIFMKARPFEIPKSIDASIMLDLSAPTL